MREQNPPPGLRVPPPPRTVAVFTVYGRPAPQGSKRFVGKSKAGRAILVESSKAVKPWRELVHSAALETRNGAAPLDGPLVLRMVFTMPKPASAPRRRQSWPDRMPDLSKLARATEDALVSAGLIADDARIVDYERLAKVYPGADQDALEAPGVRIAVRALRGLDNPAAKAAGRLSGTEPVQGGG